MTDRVYVDYETVIDGNGEAHFKRVEKSAERLGAGYVEGNKWPKTVDEKLNNDPTLSAFYEPKKGGQGAIKAG